MFLGEYQHSLDAKGRVILPAKFRDQLERGAYIAKADGCLSVFPLDEFTQIAEDVRAKARESRARREAARTFFAGATEVVPDKQGRIAIPQHLREYGGLERDVVVAGLYSRLEIWDSAKWRARERAGDESLSSESDDLADFGI